MDKKAVSLEDVKKNPQILEFIKQTEMAMKALQYTNHGLRHSNVVSGRAIEIAEAIGLDKRTAELSAIAGFCHDMGNFMTRSLHHHFGALLFSQVFMSEFEPHELAMIMQAIANHDKYEMNFVNNTSAVLVLADKSDVERSRVTSDDMNYIKGDIHNRVNYATEKSDVDIDTAKKRINLILTIDTKFCPVIEYFEIFTDRMVFCRQAAKFLGYEFGLIINDFQIA